MPFGTLATPASMGAGRVHHARLRRLSLAALGICGLALAWALIAPTAIGGPASYVVTDGTSMLPHFVANGLVVTRTQPHYRVGDVVAYHNKELRAVVMHRIVARSGERYVFKGDNNDFRDHYRPTREELVGKEWIYVPGAGRYLKMLREPLTFAALLALLTFVSLRSPARSRRRRRHHGR